MNALEDAIVASPNDPARYAVYADALMQKGDLHGELIALHLKLSSVKDPGEFAQLKASEASLRERVAARMLGALPSGFEVSWRWGFVRQLVCASDDAAALRTVLTQPALRALQAVRFSPADERLDERLGVLAAVQPRALRQLELNGGVVSETAARRTVKAFGNLEHLGLRGDDFDPALFDLPELKTLELAVLEPADAFAQRLEAAGWSALRRLSVEAPELPVQRLLPALMLPRLTQVQLDVSDFGPALKALGARENVKQLIELRLDGNVTDQQLAPLLARIHELEALRLTLPARGLTLDTVVWLRQHLKVRLLGAPGAVSEGFETVRASWRELGLPVSAH